MFQSETFHVTMQGPGGEGDGTLSDSDQLTATFRASIPPIMSGIKTGGDGLRVQFDVPESDMGEAVKLLAMRGMVLRVVVTAEREGRSYGL